MAVKWPAGEEEIIIKMVKKKRFRKETIDLYCNLYSKTKEADEKLDEFKNAIKVVMLATRKKCIQLVGSPFMLELKSVPTKSLDKDKVIELLADGLYGKNYKRDKKYKRLIRKNTKKETVDRLLEPKPNPKYKE